MNKLVLKDEKRFVLKLKNGDFDAFEILYQHYFAPLYLFAKGYLRNAADSEELIQQVFYKIWDKRKSIEPELSFKSYLYTIVLNDVFNLLKKKTYENRCRKEFKERFQDFTECTEDQVLFDNLHEKLDSLVERLPKMRQRIFILSRMNGLSNNEIARELDISIRTVENQLYRTLQFLKKNLAENL